MFTNILIYRLMPDARGVPEEAAARRCHDALARQPGFGGRLLGRNANDAEEYVEVLQWDSRAQSDSACAAVWQDPAASDWASRIDTASTKMFGVKTVGTRSRSERSLADASVGGWLLVRWRASNDADTVSQPRRELFTPHERVAPLPGYLGALQFEEIEGSERAELIAWSSLETARQRLPEVFASEDATVHFLDPVLRS